MFSMIEEYIGSMEAATYVKVFLNLALCLLKSTVIILLGLTSAAICNHLIERMAASWRTHGYTRKADTLAVVLTSLTRYGIGFLVVCAVLGVFNIPIGSILAVAGIGSVAIGFGAQSLVKDFITGFFILLEDQFGVGDLVTLSGKTGIVEAIGIRTTRIRGLDGDMHIFPNSQIQFVSNLSNSHCRAVIEVGLNNANALSVLCDEMRTAKDSLGLTSEPSVVVIAEPPGGGAGIRIIADCRAGESATVEQALKQLIRQRFDSTGIEYKID